MNTTHTPGPWEKEFDDYGEEIWFGGEGRGYWTIGPALLGGEGPSPEGLARMEADAMLIQAAPDMLQALHAANCYLASESQSIYDVMTAREFIVNAIYKADPQHDFRDFKTKKTQP